MWALHLTFGCKILTSKSHTYTVDCKNQVYFCVNKPLKIKQNCLSVQYSYYGILKVIKNEHDYPKKSIIVLFLYNKVSTSKLNLVLIHDYLVQ